MSTPLLPLSPGSVLAIGRLQQLRGELADLAFLLERRGRRDAADAVNVVAERIAAIEAELVGPVEAGAS